MEEPGPLLQCRSSAEVRCIAPLEAGGILKQRVSLVCKSRLTTRQRCPCNAPLEYTGPPAGLGPDSGSVLEKRREAPSPWLCTWDYIWDYREKKKMAKKLEGQKKLLKEQEGNSTSVAVLSMRFIYLLLPQKKPNWPLWSYTQAFCLLLTQGMYLGIKHPCFPVWSHSPSQFPSLSFASWVGGSAAGGDAERFVTVGISKDNNQRSGKHALNRAVMPCNRSTALCIVHPDLQGAKEWLSTRKALIVVVTCRLQQGFQHQAAHRQSQR